MGVDVRIFIHENDLSKLDLLDAIILKDKFSGRWQYCISDRFVFEESNNKLTIEEIREHLAFNSDIPQESRDIIRHIPNLRIIFQMDCEDKNIEGYINLSDFMYKYWDISIASNLKSKGIQKTKCIFSKNGKCTSDYSPLKCDGIKIPEDCTYSQITKQHLVDSK